ncbi:MAG: TIGR02266 family protein [Kofleriaceae bacterium]
MADPNTRQGKRTPVTLKIKFKSETLEQFIERYAVDVSQGGIFIRTKEPLAVGTQMKFEFQLRDASPLIAGEGTVVWTRENDPSRPAIAPGMGVRFDRLADGSQGVLEKILAEKAKQAPQRGTTETTKPPLFTDTPTRVAPAPVQDALLGQKSGRTRQDSQETPLPKPVPFHSDADEFGAEAFEEATKVRALDELVAQTASVEGGDVAGGAAILAAATQPPRDELAARRSSPSVAPVNQERESAPGLPLPPEPSGRTGKLLDTSPSPRDEAPVARSSSPSVQPQNIPSGTKLGLEPAKLPMPPREQTERVPAPRAVAAEPSGPAPKRPSAAPIVVGIIFTVAVAAAAFWYLVLREKAEDSTNKTKNPVADTGSGSAGSAMVGSAGSATVGSNGSGMIANGSDVGSAGSAAIAPLMGPTVDTIIASSIPKATITVVDTGQTGAAPFTAKLEKDKAYKVRVEAPGYVKQELDVKGGQDKVTAKLVAKPHVVSVTSDPPGGTIAIDGVSTGKKTPADVELGAAQAAKKAVHIQVRLAGYKLGDTVVDVTAMKDEDDKVTGTADLKLAVAPVVNNPPPHVDHNNTGSGSATGSASETGSATQTTPPTGDGSAAPSGGGGGEKPTGEKPAGGGGSASGGGDEPAPNWPK